MSLFCGANACKGQSAEDFRSVSAEEFAGVIADSTTVVLDVRTEEEYNEGHMEGALQIDVLQENFAAKAKELLPNGRTVALYCRSGRRSKTAAKILADEGFDVVELNTGWIGWTEYTSKK